MKVISAQEITCFFHGHLGVLTDERGVRPFRLRNTDIPWIHADLAGRARSTSGVRIRFHTNTRRIVLKGVFHPGGRTSDSQKYDLVVDGKLMETVDPSEDGRSIVFRELPVGDKQVEIWLPPHYGDLYIQQMILGDKDDTIVQDQDSRSHWVTYGSSITHSAAAYSPTRTWPAIVARHFNWNFHNLGFGGQCQFDQVVARTIADMSCDRISLCLGINTVGGTFSPRTWQPAVEGFILTVRDKHPDTPLLLISPIAFPMREYDFAEHSHMGLVPMRRMLEETWQKFVKQGDNNIYYLNGLELINQAEAPQYMPVDLLHPDAAGYEHLAEKFIARAPASWRA